MCGSCSRGFGAIFLVLGLSSRLVSWLGLETSDPMQSSVFFAPKPLSTPISSIYSPPVTVNNPGSMAASGPQWAQKTVTLPSKRRGCHLVTHEIVKEIRQDLSEFNCGLAHLFLQHTSASLTVNENYDNDVREDAETFLHKIVPEGSSAPWRHTIEGQDDMPAHIKSSMLGCTLTVPITNGKLNMGTWQGIWLCEHRDHATPRSVVITLNGICKFQDVDIHCRARKRRGPLQTQSSQLEIINLISIFAP